MPPASPQADATVCFVARNDFETKPGGDTVKWLAYVAAAAEAGFKTVKWFDDRPAPEADIFHAINLDRPYDLYPKMRAAWARGTPFVISSIHRPNAWLEKFRREHPPNGWLGSIFYRSPLGNKVNRSESVKDAIRLIRQGRFRHWAGIFPGWTRRARWLIEHARYILLLSEKEGDAFAGDFQVRLNPNKVRVLPNWITGFGEIAADEPPPSFATLTGKPVLVVGRIEAAKNSLRICRLAARAQRPLVFVGRGNPYEKGYVSEFAREVGRHGFLRWVPGISRSELPGYYRHAGFLLNASYFEGCPWVDMEALLLGCPLVTTKYSLHHEFLPLDVPKCDPYDDSDLLHWLKGQPPTRGPLQPIDPALCRKKLVDLYHDLIAA